MDKKKKIIIVFVVIALLAVIAILAFQAGRKSPNTVIPGDVENIEEVQSQLVPGVPGNPTPASPKDIIKTEKVLSAEEAAKIEILKEAKEI